MEESVPGQTRSQVSQGSAWASLPFHLMDTVLQNLQQDVPSILQIRLVCKAWRAACASFSGPAIINLSRGYDTFGVSNTLPGLHELRMSIVANRMYLPPLSSLSRLTRLRMTYTESKILPHPGRDPLFDLVILPLGIRALELYNCYVDPQSFTYIRCTALTRLEFHRTDNQVEEIEDLLRRLPLLQDLNLERLSRIESDSGSEDFDEVSDDFSGFLRCGALSKLTLSLGVLPYSPKVPASASTVRELHLKHMVVAESFLHNLQTLLPFLTELSLFDCNSPSWSQQSLHAPSTLRSLEILFSGRRYLGLAGPQTQSFAYGPVSNLSAEEEEEEMMDCIATLAGMTKLKFATVQFRHQARFSELRRLHLQDLSFRYCSGVAAALNHPDAFAVLQKLYIKEATGNVRAFEAARNELGSRQDLGEMVMMREAVFKLPCLIELSGWCRIFSLPLPATWKLWRKNITPYDPFVVWRRVA